VCGGGAGAEGLVSSCGSVMSFVVVEEEEDDEERKDLSLHVAQ